MVGRSLASWQAVLTLIRRRLDGANGVERVGARCKNPAALLAGVRV